MKDREKLLRDNAFREVSWYEPEKVKRIRKTKGNAAAEKVKTAIALSRAKKMGVNT